MPLCFAFLSQLDDAVAQDGGVLEFEHFACLLHLLFELSDLLVPLALGELALAAAAGVAGLSQTAVFSFGSYGTDGPTDAAGGYVDGESLAALNDAGLCFADILQQNDAYLALAKIGGLIMTGPTGTNVNDLAVLLLAR